MEYKHIDGQVYSRYALTPPIINSELALKYGIQIPCPVEPGPFAGLVIGRYVKLRLVIEGGTKKITCHAKIDWVRTDAATNECLVGFGSLSLTNEEFAILEESFAERPARKLEFGVSVEDKAPEAAPVVATATAKEIMRLKAVNFPVTVIEAIDAYRGKTGFSEFVAEAVREYVKTKQH